MAEFILECPLFVLFYFEILCSFVLILFIKQRISNFSKFETQICKTGQNLFSPLWKSVQWLTANFLLDQQYSRKIKESGVEVDCGALSLSELYQIRLQTKMRDPTSNISWLPYLSVTLWLSASIQLVAVEEMYHIILATQSFNNFPP